MLDLGTLAEDRYYEIKLLDGAELRLKRPSQAMYEFLLTLDKLNETDSAAVINGFSKLFERILNRNVEGAHFDREQLIEDYDFKVISYVISDYFNYWNEEVNDKVNFQ